MIKRVLLSFSVISLLVLVGLGLFLLRKNANERIKLLTHADVEIYVDCYQQIGPRWCDRYAGISRYPDRSEDARLEYYSYTGALVREFKLSNAELKAFSPMRDKEKAITCIIGKSPFEYPNFKCRFLTQVHHPSLDTVSLWMTTYTNEWEPVDAIMIAKLEPTITNQYFAQITKDGILLDQYIDGYNIESMYHMDPSGKFVMDKNEKRTLQESVAASFDEIKEGTTNVIFDIPSCSSQGLVGEYPVGEAWTTIIFEQQKTEVYTSQKYEFTGSEDDREWDEMFAPATGLDIPQNTFFDLAVKGGEHSINFYSFTSCYNPPSMEDMKIMAHIIYKTNDKTEDIICYRQGMTFNYQGSNYSFIGLETVKDKNGEYVNAKLSEEVFDKKEYNMFATEKGKSYSLLTTDCQPKLNLLEIDGRMYLVVQQYSCYEGAYVGTTVYRLLKGGLLRVYNNGIGCD